MKTESVTGPLTGIAKMAFSFKSPKRRTSKPGTVFETIEEICGETHHSGEESDNSSVEAPSLPRTPLLDDKDNRLTDTEMTRKGLSVPENSQMPKSGPLDLSALTGSFGGLAVTE